ncbi:MAG: hypothetical protein JWR32_711 [Mycobacterium sp.]|jgi:hypothetical protein|nr:hypothetical protein [Mycobacterium sp.]
MDIVLGVSMTATTVRMVLVEGERADGVTVESEVFDTIAAEDVPKPSPCEQVSNAILATQQSAFSCGHHLVASGVTWVDEPQQNLLRDSMIARDLDNVLLMSEQSAAGALAQSVGRALGYDTTAVLLMKYDTATLFSVDCADGSIAEVFTRGIGSAGLADVLPEIVTNLRTNEPHPQGVFIVGSDAEVCSVKSSLECLLALPVVVPEEPDLAVARGAALAAANTTGLEAPTVGLAYAQDPDDSRLNLSDADTEVSPPLEIEGEEDLDCLVPQTGREVLIPAGSFVGAMFVLGVVALVMSLAVSIRPTATQGLPGAEKAAAPNVVVQTPPQVQSPSAVHSPPSVPQAQLEQPQPLPASPAAAAVAPQLPVVAPVHTPAPKAGAGAPGVQQLAPSRVVTEPTQAAVEKPFEAAPAAVEPPPAELPAVPAPVAAPPPPAETPPVPAPVAAPPPPDALPPPVAAAPVPPAPQAPPLTFPWGPPTLRIGPFRIPLGPQQPGAPPRPPIVPWAPRQAPEPPAWLPPRAPPPVPRGRDGGGWWPGG